MEVVERAYFMTLRLFGNTDGTKSGRFAFTAFGNLWHHELWKPFCYFILVGTRERELR